MGEVTSVAVTSYMFIITEWLPDLNARFDHGVKMLVL